MKIVKANKSACIRIKAPPLSMADSLESQYENAIESIEKGKKLLKWFQNLND